MALVGYSDSEGSDAEASIVPKPVPEEPSTSKASFKKVVDKSNSYKIRVNLPEPAKSATTDEDQDGEGPRVKRTKTDGGTFSGFNALLPAPKRDANTKGAAEASRAKRGGLRPGENLKTGATPGFNREAVAYGSEVDASYDVHSPAADPSLPSDIASNTNEAEACPTQYWPKTIAQPPKKATIFKPLSVARKPKSKTASQRIEVKAGTDLPPVRETSSSKLKKSLFSSSEADEGPHATSWTNEGPYEPLIYQATAEAKAEDPPFASHEPDVPYPDNRIPAADPNSLHSIADSLNLSASAKRQLLGRRHKNASASDTSAVSVADFNMDSEYAANELLRQAGEQVQHNPVKSINAAGKNSLKQLVNTASSQKDALEEHFATGRRNKKEAGVKYGW